MDHVRTLIHRQRRQRGNHEVIQSLCAETATDDQQSHRATTAGESRCRIGQRGDVGAYRRTQPLDFLRPWQPPGERIPRRLLECFRKSDQYAVRDQREHTIGQSGMRPGFMYNKRLAAQHPHHAARKSDIAAHGHNDIRVDAADH